MFNIPNMLSCIRLFMVPLFAVVYFRDPTPGHWWAAGIYVVASATDVLDGIIARRSGQVTRLGRFLDPLADKLMCACVLLCIAISGLVPWWAVAIFFVKEALMGVGALLLFKRIDDVPPAKGIGKVAAAAFFFSCLLIMTVPQIPKTAAFAIIAFALALMLTAFAGYIIRFVKLTR